MNHIIYNSKYILLGKYWEDTHTLKRQQWLLHGGEIAGNLTKDFITGKFKHIHQ